MTCDLVPAHLEWLQAAGHAETTIRARQRVLTHADNHLPEGLAEASEAEIITYKATAGWSKWTRHTYDGHLRGFYAWGVHAGHLILDPMLYIPRPKQGDRTPNPCTDGELLVALTAPIQPWRMAIMLAMYAGLRCCEIVTTERRDIINGRLRIRGKGGKVRWVPVAGPLWREIEHAPPGLLCVGASRGQQLSPQMLTQMQRAVWRRLGLDDAFRLHRARHWFATSLLEAGVDVRVVQELLGHASLQSTQGYMAVTSARMVGAIQMLPDVEPTSADAGSVSALDAMYKEPEPAVTRLGPAAEAA